MKIRVTKVIIVLMVSLFAMALFNFMAGSSGHFPESVSITNDNVKTLITKDSVLTEPYVKYTLVLTNDTLIKGNFLSTNGLRPGHAAFDPFNGYVYVTNMGSGIVSVINGITSTVITNIPVGSYPDGLAFDSSNGYVYVANHNSKIVSVINGTTNTVITNITVGLSPAGVAFDPSNGYVCYNCVCYSIDNRDNLRIMIRHIHIPI